MARPRSIIAAGLLCALLGAGCVSTESLPRSRSTAPTALTREIASAETRGPAAVLDFIERRQTTARTRRDRGELALARARAQADLSQPRSALTSYRQAWSLLGPRVDGLTGDLLREWADLCLATDMPADAAEHYEQALAAEHLGASEKDVLLAGLVLASTESGDSAAAARWRSQIQGPEATLIAAARRRTLGSSGSTARSAPTPRSAHVPSDPRSIHASVRRRSDWRASPTRGNVTPMRPVTSITLHHSAMPAPGSSSASVASHLRGIQAFHVDERGWADIGYHFLVDPSGRVWEGRPLVWQGAHAGGDNNIGNVGICLLGDFDRRRVPSAQLAGAQALIESLRRSFRVPTSRVTTHQEWKEDTACPGRHLQHAVDVYRAKGRLSAGL